MSLASLASEAPVGFTHIQKFVLKGETVDKLWNQFRKKHKPAGYEVRKYTSGYGDREVWVSFVTHDPEACAKMTPDDWQGIEAFLCLILKRE